MIVPYFVGLFVISFCGGCCNTLNTPHTGKNNNYNILFFPWVDFLTKGVSVNNYQSDTV